MKPPTEFEKVVLAAVGLYLLLAADAVALAGVLLGRPSRWLAGVGVALISGLAALLARWLAYGD